MDPTASHSAECRTGAGLSKGALLCVVGARPNFMKIAPIMRALEAYRRVLPAALVHTGQHYDTAMNESFFTQLGIPRPDVDLGVGSGSHSQQTAEIMRRFEPVVDAVQPVAVLVVGDVNSTIACALVAAKKGIPVVHVEAGLRSGDRSMPEEINRVLTDQLSDLLFTTEADARANLQAEGIAAERVHFVGNVMIDTLLYNQARAVAVADTMAPYAGDAPRDWAGRYAVLTLHRPSNVDDAATLKALLTAIGELSTRLPVVFPVHPRTRAAIEAAGLETMLAAWPQLYRLPPVGYLEMLGLVRDAKLILTDSGGLQEESTALGVPCVTLRNNTERPITVAQGTNTVVGNEPAAMLAAVQEILAGGGKAGRVPPLWDGRAAERICAQLAQSYGLHADAASAPSAHMK